MNQQAPPDGNTTTGPKALAIISIVFAMAIMFYSLRIYTRLRPAKKLDTSDYFISGAVVAEIIVFSAMVAAVTKGFGRHNYYLTAKDKVNIFRCLFCIEVLGLWVLSLARISVACMLLRLDKALFTSWKVILWIAIIFQLGAAFGSNICQFIRCRPLHAMWDVVPHAKCWDPIESWIYGYVFAGISIGSDLTFAIMPMFFVWKLNRPLLERILITVLMALGLFATGAAVLKLYYLRAYNLTVNDSLRTMVVLFIWCRIEEFVLITSACAPFLKSPIEQILSRFGVPMFKNKTRELNSLHFANDSN
ncbi:hypothetical protein V8E51_015520 [Hyaloscypha variabilis]